jgi:hypothetical protein
LAATVGGRPAPATAERLTILVDGKEVLLADVLAQHGVSRGVYLSRLRGGWDEERAATTSGNPRARYLVVNGIQERLSQVLERHGVLYGTYAARVGLGWDRVRAATTPPGASGSPPPGEVRPAVVIAGGSVEVDGKPEALSTVLARHGVSDQTFRRRVRRGWVPERAATTPQPPSNWTRAEILVDGKVELLVDVLARHGVRPVTFYSRVRKRWDRVEAATTPPGAREPRGPREVP